MNQQIVFQKPGTFVRFPASEKKSSSSRFFELAFKEPVTRSLFENNKISCEFSKGDLRNGVRNRFGKRVLWIYVGSQQSLASLIEMENDPSVVAGYRKGLENNVDYCLTSVKGYKLFDNNDTKVFGHAKWREAYPTRFPQPTQAEAQRLSSLGNKEKMDERKNYETRWMRNPMAGATIAALSQDPSHQKIVKQAITHYDYSKINIAEFFFAECAYCALNSEQ